MIATRAFHPVAASTASAISAGVGTAALATELHALGKNAGEFVVEFGHEPTSLQRFRGERGRARTGEGIKDEVPRPRQELDEEHRELKRKPCRVPRRIWTELGF